MDTVPWLSLGGEAVLPDDTVSFAPLFFSNPRSACCERLGNRIGAIR